MNSNQQHDLRQLSQKLTFHVEQLAEWIREHSSKPNEIIELIEAEKFIKSMVGE